MDRTVLALALVAALAVTAGCLGDDEADPADAAGGGNATEAVADQWWKGSIPWGDNHTHSNRSQHRGLNTANFEVIGYDPLVTEALNSTPTGMSCGGTAQREDGRRLALVHTFDTEVAFIVADVTDPANPVKLGEYILPNVHVWDATLSADGEHALVGAYPPVLKPGWEPHLPPPPDTGPMPEMDRRKVKVQPKFRNACTGEVVDLGPERYLPMGPSLILVGLQDPTDPELEDAVPQPVIGPHSVSSSKVDGTVYATSSVTNLVHEATYYSFFEVQETPQGGKLAPLSVIRAPGHPPPGELNGHIDVTLQTHPKTGDPLAYLANWDEGVAVYDMSNPRVPRKLGSWEEDTQGSIHETLPLPTLRNGTHLTIAGQEVGERENLPSGIVFILNTTDPANPKEVGRWTIPVKPQGWPGLMFSTHYVEVVGDTMFVSNYHGGLWAVDISDPSQPRAVGHFLPNRTSPKPHPDAGPPSVNDVHAGPNGTLTIWDASAGIYQLDFDASTPAPEAPPWPGLDDA